MKDLTVLFITANLMPERWRKYHLGVLLEAVGDYPLISISRKPMDLGINILDTEEKNVLNVFRQLLVGAKAAKTKYVAHVEDDTLYCRDHFDFYRPSDDTFAYNLHRWGLYTWNPIFSMMLRKTGAALIAPRELLIKALEERFMKYPTLADYKGRLCHFIGEPGRNRYESVLGLTQWKSVEVYSNTAIIQLTHPSGMEYAHLDTKTSDKVHYRKRLGSIKANTIPFWGKGEDIVKYYNETDGL